jgi:Tfp pilus tip-associated adhesin PilY1
MIHAIRTNPDDAADPTNGLEAWAYVPRWVAGSLIADAASGTASAFPDGSPTLAEVKLADGALHTVALISGGNGGKSVVALDVTDTVVGGTVVGPTPLWEIQPLAAEAGQAHAKPAIARV